MNRKWPSVWPALVAAAVAITAVRLPPGHLGQPGEGVLPSVAGGGPLPCTGALTEPEPGRGDPLPIDGVLVGTNYTHHRARSDCSLRGAGIVDTYNCPGVRERVRGQLRTMRARGIQSLRLIVWHQRDPGGADWGVVPSSPRGLDTRAAANLSAFVADVRDAGFVRLTLSFGPVGENAPRSDLYDPSTFEENLAVIFQVRDIADRFGPRSVRFDLLNEGAPGFPHRVEIRSRISRYLTRLYRAYARRHGTEAVTVSSIASVGAVADTERLEGLIDALAASGHRLPSAFEVHLSYDGEQAADILESLDNGMSRRGLHQAIVVGETAYDAPGVASAVADFVERGGRRVEEVMQWPLTSDRPCQTVNVPPPYRAHAYLDALRPSLRAPPGESDFPHVDRN